KILYLSSWHLNKNIHILPEVAYFLRKYDKKIKFILSLNKDNQNVRKYLLQKIKKFKVEDYFIFIGKVPAKYVHQIIKNADAMILLSKLECFSSNIIEAFYFKKPLIIANEPWSRSVCENAALYVDRENPENISLAITKLMSDFTL